MTNSLPRTLTPEMIAAARVLISTTHPNDASLGRALDKASGRLLTLPWTIDMGILQIASHSHPQDVHSTDGDDCTCPTSRGVCYHRACWMILSAVASTGIHPIAPLPLPSVLDEDDLPGSFLDGDFSCFEDTELTAPAGGVWYKGEYFTAEHCDAAAKARQAAQNDSGSTEAAFYEVDVLPVSLKRVQPVPFRLQPSVIRPNPLDTDVDALFAA